MTLSECSITTSCTLSLSCFFVTKLFLFAVSLSPHSRLVQVSLLPSVWPDVEIKSNPNFTISCPKRSHSCYYLTGMLSNKLIKSIYLWVTLGKNMTQRTLENRPIWSHTDCHSLQSFGFLGAEILETCSTQSRNYRRAFWHFSKPSFSCCRYW